jgi:hypothetical protein
VNPIVIRGESLLVGVSESIEADCRRLNPQELIDLNHECSYLMHQATAKQCMAAYLIFAVTEALLHPDDNITGTVQTDAGASGPEVGGSPDLGGS